MVLNRFRRGVSRIEAEEGIPREEYVEVGVAESSGPGRIGIAIEKLEDFADTERILRAVRNGSLVFLKIKTMKEKDLGELKRSVEKLKKTVLAQNGDIVGVENDWLILAPEHAKVER
ncbi:MAG: cell division protein SepF [Candidatus Aenigmarchaeota archaeon]|nr:cell division protein SepF [Candidatus Aenigmarchaeota archaeon]